MQNKNKYSLQLSFSFDEIEEHAIKKKQGVIRAHMARLGRIIYRLKTEARALGVSEEAMEGLTDALNPDHVNALRTLIAEARDHESSQEQSASGTSASAAVSPPAASAAAAPASSADAASPSYPSLGPRFAQWRRALRAKQKKLETVHDAAALAAGISLERRLQWLDDNEKNLNDLLDNIHEESFFVVSDGSSNALMASSAAGEGKGTKRAFSCGEGSEEGVERKKVRSE